MPVAETTAQDVTDVLDRLQQTASDRKTVWGLPIPWRARPVFARGFVVAPDFGNANQVIVVTYQVPAGYTAVLCGLVLGYIGGGGSALPGQVLYTVDVNSPTPVPVPGVGRAEKDYAFVPFQLGSFVPGDPWPVEFVHDQAETVRIKGQTVSGVATGAGNFLFGALIGWQWPSMGWER